MRVLVRSANAAVAPAAEQQQPLPHVNQGSNDSPPTDQGFTRPPLIILNKRLQARELGLEASRVGPRSVHGASGGGHWPSDRLLFSNINKSRGGQQE